VGSLLSWLKPLDAPGSIPVLIICCVLALLLRFVWPRKRWLAGAWLGSVFALYLFLALPVVAHGIAGALPAVPQARLWHGEPLDSLVIFDGDNRRGRVAEARRVYDLGKPGVVQLLGSAWMLDALWHNGIPYNAIKHTERPTTRAQVDWVRNYVAGAEGLRMAIVASRLQLPRIDALLERAGVVVPLAAAPADIEPATTGVRRWIPTYFALRISRDALYEHMAIWYYRKKQWIAGR